MNKQWDVENAVLTDKEVETGDLAVELLSPMPEEAPAGVNTQLKVAILTEEGVEEEELTSPKAALEQAGIQVEVVSPHHGKIKAWAHTDWGQDIPVDKDLDEARPDEYDALVLPGGVMNPDKLRQNSTALNFVKKFIQAGKTIAAICHGAQTLIETKMIEGRTMTSYPSLQTDLRNAGVNWVDKEVVHDGQFITSRSPRDLDAFNGELLRDLNAPR